MPDIYQVMIFLYHKSNDYHLMYQVKIKSAMYVEMMMIVVIRFSVQVVVVHSIKIVYLHAPKEMSIVMLEMPVL